MRRVFFITIFAFLFFLIEFILFNLVGRWFMPNLGLLLIVFFNLYLGIRYSLYTAIISGVLKDSFSTSIFGINLFSFIICAFLTTLLKKYIYRRGSRSSRLLLVFFICMINGMIQFFLHMMFGPVDFMQTFKYIFIPEVLATLIVTSLVLNQLMKCVSRLSV